MTLPLRTRARSTPTLPSAPKKIRERYSLPTETCRAVKTARWPPPDAVLSVATRKVMSTSLTSTDDTAAVEDAPFRFRTSRPAPSTLALESLSETEYAPPTAALPQPDETTRLKESETTVADEGGGGGGIGAGG